MPNTWSVGIALEARIENKGEMLTYAKENISRRRYVRECFERGKIANVCETLHFA
jgi:hypothetical protein